MGRRNVAPTGATGVRSRMPETPPKAVGSPAGVMASKETTAGGEFNAPNGQDLAWTQDAMTSWGRKVITWGKKHPGKMYYQVYEADDQYVNWCLSRINSLNTPILGISPRLRGTKKRSNRPPYKLRTKSRSPSPFDSTDTGALCFLASGVGTKSSISCLWERQPWYRICPFLIFAIGSED